MSTPGTLQPPAPATASYATRRAGGAVFGGGRALAWLLVITGAAGLVAAWVITLDKFALLQDPNFVPACSLNPVVTCGNIMKSGQAAAFGFPNPLLGLVAYGMVMCAGAIILSVGFFGSAALVGYPDLVRQAPEFSTLVLAINLTLPMVAWMRFRNHEWRPTLEMGGATMALGIALIAAGWLGIIPASDMFEWEKSLACPVMFIAMLFRLDLYTSHAGHKAHSAHG